MFDKVRILHDFLSSGGPAGGFEKQVIMVWIDGLGD